tara:strand:+ start:550 stop:765 length:216 start_codon:yes stop_codon:yes gene_type:complete
MIIVKEGDKFRVLVMFDGEMYSLGLYDTEEHAINSYNAMKKKHYIILGDDLKIPPRNGTNASPTLRRLEPR